MAAAAVDSVSRLYKDLEKTYSEAMDGVEKAAEEAVASVTFPIFNIPQGQLIPAQCWKIMYLLKPASPSYACPVRKKNIRRRRCNKCKGCLMEDCGRCYDCQRKRICKKKKCLDPLLPPATRCLICTQTGTVSALSECSTCGEILHPRCVAVLGERGSKDGRTSQTWECPKCCQGKIAHTGGRTYSGPLPTLLENSLLLAGFTDYLARNCWALGLCDTDSLGWGGDPGEILRQLAGIWVEHLPIAKKGLSGEDFEGLVVSLEDSVAVLEWYGQNHGMFDGLVPLARRMVGVVEEVKSGYWEEEDPYLMEKMELPKRKRSSRKSQSTTSKKSPRSGSDSSPLEKKSSLFRFLTSGHSSADSSPVVPASDVCSPESCTDTAAENSLACIQPADKTTSLPTPQVEDKQVGGEGVGPNKEPDSGTPSDLSNTPDSDPFPQFSRKSDSAFPSSWYVDDSDSEDYLPTPPRGPSPQPANQTDRSLPESPQPSPKRLREDSSDYMNDALDVMFEHAHPSLSSTSGSIKMSANSATADDFVNDVRKKLQDFFSATEAREARYEESPSFSNSTGSLAPSGHTYQRQAMECGSPHAGLQIRQTATTQSPPTGYPQAAFPQQMQPGHWDPTINRPPPAAGQSATGYNSICHCAACCRPQTYMQQPHHSRASKKTQRTAPPVSHTPAGRSSHATVANIPPVRSYSPSWHATHPQLQPATNRSGTSAYPQGTMCGNDGSWFDVDMMQPMPTAYHATVQMSLAPQETRKVQGHPAQPRAPLGDSNRYIPPARYGGMRSKGTKDAQHHSYWPVE